MCTPSWGCSKKAYNIPCAKFKRQLLTTANLRAEHVQAWRLQSLWGSLTCGALRHWIWKEQYWLDWPCESILDLPNYTFSPGYRLFLRAQHGLLTWGSRSKGKGLSHPLYTSYIMSAGSRRSMLKGQRRQRFLKHYPWSLLPCVIHQNSHGDISESKKEKI